MSEIPHKVVLIGEANVGKLEIISQFTSGSYNTESLTAPFYRKCLETKDGNSVLFDIYDTIANDVKYRSLTKTFYRDAKAIIFVYDITNEKSFKELKEYWYEQMKQLTNEDVIFVVAGNKSELIEDSKVSNEEGEQWAKSIGAVFFPTSAKNDSGIHAMFDYIGEKINNPKYDYYAEKKKRKEEKNRKKEVDKEIKLSPSNNKGKKDCVIY